MSETKTKYGYWFHLSSTQAIRKAQVRVMHIEKDPSLIKKAAELYIRDHISTSDTPAHRGGLVEVEVGSVITTREEDDPRRSYNITDVDGNLSSLQFVGTPRKLLMCRAYRPSVDFKDLKYNAEHNMIIPVNAIIPTKPESDCICGKPLEYFYKDCGWHSVHSTWDGGKSLSGSHTAGACCKACSEKADEEAYAEIERG